jgi:pyrroline-5-carboxylate reductase
MDVLLIGCGKMGGALLSRWIKAPGTSFAIVGPNMETAPDGVTLFSGPGDVAGRLFDLIIVAIKPQLVDTVLPSYQQNIAAQGAIMSIAAGCSIARLKNVLGDVPIIRVMPNLPSEIGKGVSGLFASDDTGSAHRSSIETLMALAGNICLGR